MWEKKEDKDSQRLDAAGRSPSETGVSHVGDRIRLLRRELGLSQGELARRAGINRSYLSMVENGKSSPTLDVAERLARAMEMNVSDLFARGWNRHYRYDSDTIMDTYPGLKELLESEEDLLLMNPSADEIALLKSIRFNGSFNPSKQFFIDTLIHFRRQKR